ncbi:MAG TPA: VWA domain-containing protein [Abditibacteriaceae bacterium]|nr:VWA domain-containing protein [Abditibacteriaceae bacterium]
MNFGLSFLNPWALALFPPLVAFFAWTSRRTLADLSNGRRRLALGVRVLVCGLLILALAGAQLVRFNRDLAVMFVVDYSDSVGPDAKERAAQFIENAVKNRRAGDQWGVVVFGRDAFIQLAPGTSPSLGKIQTVPPGQFTDIAAALRLATASLPDGMRKRIVLLSDGNENLGDALGEAQSARNNDVRVDVVPLSEPPKHEILVEKVVTPGEAKIGEPLEVRVIARATSSTRAQIKLFRDGVFLGTKPVELGRGRNVFNFPQTVTKPGAATFEAQIETTKGNDTLAENNRGLSFVNVQGKPRILVVGDDPLQARFLTSALAREKVDVEARGAGGLPNNLRAMQAYDAIVLNDVPAWELSTAQMASLQSYVRDLGCGLVMIGGENSFGPGGYRSTPVEESLPVTMDIRNTQFLPGGAVAMVMHSMEFPQGNDWAKAVCAQVTRQMGDEDYAGLIIYGMDASWVYPMLKVGPNRNLMLTKIKGINPGDMPDFDAALQTAYDGLIKTSAYLKHCIILSDGDPSPPRSSLVAKFNKAKITVSTVVINPHDPSGAQNMFQISKQHGGRFYQVRNARQIPNIFLKEAATVSRSAIIEEPFQPRLEAPSSILKGINTLPKLLGYVGTSPRTVREGSRVVLSTHQGDPLLATRQYGLGKSVAWTSDARQRWAAAWLGWQGFSKFWAQTVRWSMRTSSANDLQTNVDINKGQGKVTIEAVDAQGNFVNFLNPKARLVPPNLKGVELPLEQTGPGKYEATFDARELGAYLVNIRTRRGDKDVSQIAGGTLPYSPEYGAVGSDLFLLSQIAQNSGGTEVKPDQVFERPRTPAKTPKDIWLPLLMIAACLFPFDVAVRRVLWGEEEWRNFRERRAKRAGAPTQSSTRSPTVAPRDEGLSRLRRAKQRATESEIAPPVTTTPTEFSPTVAPTPQPIQPIVEPKTEVAPPQTDASSTRSSEEPEDAGDAMARLRAAKRRARGEE